MDIEAPVGPLAKWVFVSGCSEGTTPLGLYVGKQAIVHHDFNDVRDHDRDYAFINVYSGVVSSSPDVLTNVGRLVDNVGGQGLASDTDGDNRYDTGVSPYFDGEVFTVYRNAATRWSGSIA